jgi:tetratricopeptide (TPR) repeat protein
MEPSLQATADQLAQARRQPDAARLADALLRHANALAAHGQLAHASSALDEALQVQRQRDARDDVLRCLLLSAELLRLQGRRAEARARAVEGLALTVEGSHDHAQAQAVIGEIALSDGDATAAEQALSAALAIAPEAPAWWRSRARARAALGRFEASATDLETAHARCIALGDGTAARRVAIEAATAWHHAGRRDRAAALIATTLAQARAAGDENALGALELLDATAALERRDADAARGHAQAARAHALASRAPDTYIGASIALATLAEHGADDPAAYGALATGWATLSDLLGPELARATFEPPLRALRLRWGAQRFDAARAAHEASRRVRPETP